MTMPEQRERTGRTTAKFKAFFNGNCYGPDGDFVSRGEEIVFINREPWHAECAEREGYTVPHD
jgi:hypothetical protein